MGMNAWGKDELQACTKDSQHELFAIYLRKFDSQVRMLKDRRCNIVLP